MVPRRPPVVGLPRRVEGARLTRCALAADRCQIASRQDDPVQVEALDPQKMRQVQHLPAIRRRQELTQPVWYGLRSAAPSGMNP